VWSTNRAEKPDEQVVQVMGARFAWQFTYQAPVTPLPEDVVLADLSQGLQDDIADDGIISFSSTALHTYVGRPVKLEMESQDVIHSFWVPAMRIKQDVIPGRVTEVRFTPILASSDDRAFPVVCAELCGGGHGQMRIPSGVIVYETEEEYNDWVQEQVNSRLYPPDNPVLRGEQILASGTYNCNGCHTLDDEDISWTGITGPNLEGVGDRAATTRASATGLSPYEYLQQSIHEPGAFLVPGFGNIMIVQPPPSEQDIADMAAFLCTQTATGESACAEITPPESE
jgi:cytochrome c oxidase subunit 2